MSSHSPPTSPATVEAVDDDLKWKEWKQWKERQEWKEWKEWKGWKERKERRERREGKKREQTQEEGRNIDLDPRLKTSEPISRPQGINKYAPPASRSTGWSGMYRAIREYDQETLKNYQDDLDNLLVFTGLFSAILTAFLIESYPKLLGDNSGGSSSGQGQQTDQPMVYNVSQGLEPTAASPSPSSSFQPSALDIRTNVLWFASLTLSLSAVFFGILVKQWLREYMAFKNPSPKARLRIRHVRHPALAAWKVFTIASLLPMLVHLSLALFFVGLIYFAKSVHPTIEYTVLPLVSAWGFCFVSCAGLPLFFPNCPYRTAISKGVYVWYNQGIAWLYRHAGNSVRWWSTSLFGSFHEKAHVRDENDEAVAALTEHKDLEVLSAADATQANDKLLITEVAEIARQVDLRKTPLHAAPKFISDLLRNRLAFSQGNDDHGFGMILDLRSTTLSPQAQDAIMNMVLQFIPHLPSSYQGLPASVSRSKLGSRNLAPEVELLQPQLLFVLLLCLSGKPLPKVPTEQSLQEKAPLITHLSQRKRGAEIIIFCQKIVQSSLRGGTMRNPYWKTSSPDKRLVNLLHGISLVHTAVQAQWGLAEALRSTGFMTQVYPELDDPALLPKDLSSPAKAQKLLTSFGCRAMHYVVTLDNRTGRLDRAIIHDVMKGLYNELQQRMQKPSDTVPPEGSVASMKERSNMVPSKESVASILEVDPITLDSLVMLISFQSWRPQWFQLENLWSNFLPSQIGEAERRIFTLAICCVPTAGILRLCWRAASHTHSSGRRVITGMNAKAWNDVLKYGLDCDLVRDASDATHILKLLSFSMYLYVFSTPRLPKPSDDEEKIWKTIFERFASSLDGPYTSPCDSKNKICRRRKPTSTLATVCLEMIRFEEILARIMHHHAEDPSPKKPGELEDYSMFRYKSGRTVDATLVLKWQTPPPPQPESEPEPKLDSEPAPLCSVPLPQLESDPQPQPQPQPESEFEPKLDSEPAPLCSVPPPPPQPESESGPNLGEPEPLFSVFSMRLIRALEVLAEPFWNTLTRDKLMSRLDHTRQTIKFREVCVTYEKRIQELVKIKDRDTSAWLRNHCGCQTVPDEKRGSLQKVWRIRGSRGNTSHEDTATSGPLNA